MNYSFYGGRKGNSFIIAGRFPTIKAMQDAFKLGPNYQEIHFDEYVLIDTDNKNNPDNGKIYKRGYDYSNKSYGAEYIGQIVGPSGPAPELQLSTMDNVKETATTENVKLYSGSYKLNTGLVPGFIPGSDKNTNQYNDEIQWNACSIRNEDNTEATAYIGFTFPYLVIDFTAKSEDAYYPKKLIEKDSATSSHPFYDKYTIHIPKGVKGESIENLKVGTKKDVQEDYLGKNEDTDSDQIITYTLRNYDQTSDGEMHTHYLSDFTMISGIELTKNKQDTTEELLQINYTHGMPNTFPLNQINQMTIDTNNGNLLVRYNDLKRRGTYQYDNINDWVSLGCVRSERGILVGFNLSPDTTGYSISNMLNYLNLNYPIGLTQELKGKIVTIGTDDSGKEFFAFDYLKNKWYHLGSIASAAGQTTQTPFCIADIDGGAIYNKYYEAMPNNSLFFVIENIPDIKV